MIKFNLACDQRHDFEAWFSSSADFDDQQTKALVTCPVCGSTKVEKALMVPAVSTGRSQDKKQQKLAADARQEVMSNIREMVNHVESNTEDVGTRFSEEARKMHYGESQARGIRGQASMDEVHELVDEGVEIVPIPELPDEKN
jgi:hypothetical protein